MRLSDECSCVVWCYKLCLDILDEDEDGHRIVLLTELHMYV